MPTIYNAAVPGPVTRPLSATPGSGPPGIAVVNQWAGSYGQGTTFTTITSALQSCVIQLDSGSSVGGGSGTPTAGNWLFVIASWTQDPSIINVHTGVSDDIHSYWRQFPASGASDNVRTSISYTPNLARGPGYVYVAPDGQIAAINVLVVEVSGLGPWDTVVGPDTNYAGAATSLALSLGAPSAASFFIAGVGGDTTAVTQTFSPAGYTTLHSLSQTNGTNHLADNVLTSAYIASSSGSQSISASTSGGSSDLSGFLIGVYTTGTNPIPAGGNPNWPYIKFEAAFGAGFNTPNSELTWTDLTSRLWHFDETTGIQYQLGQLQATNLDLELDNNDGYLSPDNASSPYYPNVVAGTPIRLRAALGTMAGNTYNRWYVIQRNIAQVGEQITTAFRRYIPMTGTDLWAALSTTPPTFYRSEVYGDNPYAWWPCDDQPKDANVLPTSLLNAAAGDTNALNVVLSPSGGALQYYYSTTGATTNIGGGNPAVTGPTIAVYTVGADSGWMFGDPQSSSPTLAAGNLLAATGNSVTAEAGSAAWQALGQGGNTGSYGFFLSCNDANFPVLANGITVEGWFNYTFFGSSSGWWVSGSSYDVLAQQPYSVLTLMELATASHPVAVLQLDLSGHLNLITYNGSTGTSHSIYTTSDLRCGNWFMVTMTLTTTTWNVQVNGSATANVSGTATGMTSAWTWLILNGDLGTNGGSSAGTGLVHGGNVAISHIAVYPYILPYYRIMGHYWAAATAFGLLPAPSGVQIQAIPVYANQTGLQTPDTLASEVAAPDGTGFSGGISSSSPWYDFSAGQAIDIIISSIAPGSITSGPSAWAAQTGQSRTAFSGNNVGIFWVSWSGVAPQFNVYTADSLGSEALSAVALGSGDCFVEGFGGSATGVGVSQVSGATGASPPTAPTAIGDTAGQRIERLMRNGRTVSPQRSIDPAPLPVQAPGTQGGGLQAGSAIQAVQQSDSGLLFIDNTGNLTYWQRPHLASQYSNPVWAIGPTTGSGEIPYYREIKWVTDPQRIWNAIQVVPFSPTGAQLPLITPTDYSAVQASQLRYGAQPLQVQSLLQSQTEMANQANWLFAQFGQPQRRAEQVKIDASAYPAAWELFLGVNVSDVVTLEDWEIGGGGTNNTFRVTEIRRTLSFGAKENDITATVELVTDYEPTDYWT